MRGAVALLALLVACTAGGAPTSAPPEGSSPVATPQAPSAPTPAHTTPATPVPPDTLTPVRPSDEPTLPAAWIRGPDAPVALTEVAAAAHDGLLWVAGGLTDQGQASAELWGLDPQAGEWTRGPDLPQPLHHAALVSDGQGLWLLGGYVGPQFASPTPAVRMLRDGSWQDGPPLPGPRAAGAAAWDGRRIVYVGGVSLDGVHDQVLALADGAWTTVGTLSVGREHLAAASDAAGSVWVLGGRTAGLDSNLGTVEVVTTAGIIELGAPLQPRGGVAAFHAPRLGGCLVGGEEPTGTLATVECVTVEGGVTSLPDLAVPRHGLGAAVLDGAAYALLGGEQPGLFTSAVVEVLTLPGG